MRPQMTCGLTALMLLWGTGSAVAAAMYRWVDDQGVVHYSDTPQPGAQRIQMESAQTYQAPPPPSIKSNSSSPSKMRAPVSAPTYQSCRIVQPTAEQSFFAPESVPVSVELQPPLQPGDQLIVVVDGVPLSAAGSDAVDFRVDQPSRGSHTVNVTVQGADGKVACTAPAVTFDVERPSVLTPQSPARGH